MDETNIIDGTLLPVCKNPNFTMSSVRTRFQQTTVGAWFCQVIKIELEVDVCIINGATIKGGVEAYEGNMLSYSQLKKEVRSGEENFVQPTIQPFSSLAVHRSFHFR